ncbi:potassium channel subfamily K member 5a [Polypterus senegalus]
MVDRGPLLTSAIIFYLSIGAAIFQVLEEPNWQRAVDDYKLKKSQIIKDFPCLTQKDLERILEVVSEAAGQGVTITGNHTFNNWNWTNAVIFAATVITTIGYGNIAPKTSPGRVFCIFYGLFGVPLCLTWISALGKFFGGRAKYLGQFLTKRGIALRKAQITCTAVFIIWGVLIHLVLPPLVFMKTENWSYIEGLYYSFITIATIGFGDLVAGVNPDIEYHVLYRYFVELWIYLGLAWLSLFINWKVSMFVEVHKALKKRRKRRKESLEDSPHHQRKKPALHLATSEDVNIFTFLSKKEEGYNDLIKQIGSEALKNSGPVGRSTSSSSKILRFDRSPRHSRTLSRRDVTIFSPNFTFDDSASLNGVENREQLLHPLRESKDPELKDRNFENQLDKSRDDQGRWDGNSYQPLIFQNNNITFIDEENLLEEERKGKLSLEDNEIELHEVAVSESEGSSVFTIDSSERSLSYERLVEEYAKDGRPHLLPLT